jgi:iron complex outermembrane receptor protein
MVAGWQLAHRLDARWQLLQDFRQAGLRSQYSVLNPVSLSGRVLTRMAARYDTQMESSQLDTRLQGQLQQGAAEHTVVLGLDLTRMHQAEQRYRGDAPSLDLDAPVYGLPVAMASQAVARWRRTCSRPACTCRTRSVTARWSGRWAAATTASPTPTATWHRSAHRHACPCIEPSRRIVVEAVAVAGAVPEREHLIPAAAGAGCGWPAVLPSRSRQVEAGIKFQPEAQRALYSAALFQITGIMSSPAIRRTPLSVDQARCVRAAWSWRRAVRCGPD